MCLLTSPYKLKVASSEKNMFSVNQLFSSHLLIISLQSYKRLSKSLLQAFLQDSSQNISIAVLKALWFLSDENVEKCESFYIGRAMSSLRPYLGMSVTVPCSANLRKMSQRVKWEIKSFALNKLFFEITHKSITCVVVSPQMRQLLKFVSFRKKFRSLGTF